MNTTTDKFKRRRQLIKASRLVRKESMKVNKEFSRIEHDLKAE